MPAPHAFHSRWCHPLLGFLITLPLSSSLAGCGKAATCQPTCGASQICQNGTCVAAPPVDAGMPPPSDGGMMEIPLSGCTALDYWANVTIGGQTFQLSVDTGSTITAVASSSCTDCSGVSPLYQPGPSATNENARASTTYLDNSGWAGTLYQDTVQPENIAQSVSLDVVAIDMQMGFFLMTGCDGAMQPSPIQGILGLGPPDLAVTPGGAYFQQWEMATGLPDLFAVQLCDAGGRLWLGGYDSAAITAAPQYTPMLPSKYYAITVSDVAVDGTSLSFGASTLGPVVVDIGSSTSMVPQAVFNALVNALQPNAAFQAMSTNAPDWFTSNKCVTAPLTEVNALPRLMLTLPGATGGSFVLDLPALGSYIAPVQSNGMTYYCPAIAVGGTTIMGSRMMTTQLTIFDLQTNQVGFAPQHTCP